MRILFSGMQIYADKILDVIHIYIWKKIALVS